MMSKNLPFHDLGMTDYQSTLQKMQDFTRHRGHEIDDQLWLTEHYPVFTQGLAGKAQHLLNTGNIPVIQSDRGGQVTYHGPGQAIIYLLLDLKRKNISARPLVTMIEKSVIDCLKIYNITTHARADAPGIYLADGRKIASLGLKISRGCSYHGVSIDVNMDLEPFTRINPCGLIGMKMGQIIEFDTEISVNTIQNDFVKIFSQRWYSSN